MDRLRTDSPDFHRVVWNTCIYTLVTTIFKLALGLWLAMKLLRRAGLGRSGAAMSG